MKLLLAAASLLFALSGAAQPQPSPASPPAQASVTFDFDWHDGIPWQTYSITVQADGKTHFQGLPAPDEAGGDTDPFQQDFTLSDANRQMVFDLARKLNYFRGDYDSHLKKIAQTGRKTLEYKSAETQGSTTYNYSPNPDVQKLTNFFQGIATTLDYGRKLAFQYRFDKLGMEQRLKELEGLQANHFVKELDALAPILRKIANDPNLMRISRQTAQQLLKGMNTPGLASQTPTPP